MQKSTTAIRSATDADLVAISNIYNHYVRHSTCTYQEEPETVEDRRQWFQHHGELHPVIVAETDGQVIGWDPFRHTTRARRTGAQ